jgi:transposase IS200 family protein/GAF domain-containing protein
VVDPAGAVLWRDGSAPVRRRADGLGFVEGVCWHENVVGTNAIGTSLVARRPIQVYSAEHYVRTHHPWTCAAAPLHDPRDGRLLGVVDLSGPARTVHATTLALVDAVARLAESWLRNEHLAQLYRLRASALPALTTVPGRAVVADRHGWVAAAAGLAPVDRIAQPTRCEPGQVWLPAFGSCVLEPLPGGCLVRLAGEDGAVTRAVLDLRRSEPTLTITGTAGAWTQALSHRHPEMLYLLAVHRDGRSAAELATDLFGDSARTVTVRAEMSWLRRNFGRGAGTAALPVRRRRRGRHQWNVARGPPALAGGGIASSSSYKRTVFEVMPDHVHLFVEHEPKASAWSVANRFKGYPSRVLREEFPHLRSRMPTLWSWSLFVVSVGVVSADTVQRYIDTQWERPCVQPRLRCGSVREKRATVGTLLRRTGPRKRNSSAFAADTPTTQIAWAR